MKLLAPLTAILAAATATQVFQSTYQEVQPIENYAHTAEIYQSTQEFQQQGLYAGQSQDYGHQESFQSRPSGEHTAKITHYNMDNNGHNYQYSYETDNGKYRPESEAESYHQQQYQPQQSEFEGHYHQNAGYHTPQLAQNAQYHQYLRR